MYIPEYTLWAMISAIVTIGLAWRLYPGLFARGTYYVFLGIIFAFKWFVNGYLTGKNIILYNPDRYSGIRLGTIPMEDFLFGFSMVTMTVVLWEFFSARFGKARLKEFDRRD